MKGCKSAELDFEKLIEGINGGAEIPAVSPEDLTAALLFFSEVRKAMPEAGSGKQRAFGFFADDLEAKCSSKADALMIAVRGLLLELTLAQIENNGGGEQKAFDGVAVTRTLAEMPLTGCDLPAKEAIVERALKLMIKE